MGRSKVEFRDSLKKFPSSLQGVAVSLGLDGKDEKPDFNRVFDLDYRPTFNEIKYCIQDSRIIAHAISKEYDKGRMRLTASSESYNRIVNEVAKFDTYFPQLSDYEDSFVRNAYKGGYVYLNPKYKNEEIRNIRVYDANSLYPAQMVYRPLPIGAGWREPPKREDQLYIVRYYAEFKLKKGFLPTIQIKGNTRYIGRESEYLKESDGLTELYQTNLDYELAHKHYNFKNEYGHEYITYNSKVGVLAPIILSNNERKERASIEGNGYERLTAKLDSNMSYGAFGINPKGYGCEPRLKDDKIRLVAVEESRKSRYVPYACFVTAWGRYTTITSAQANYESFVYSDTDSLHLTADAQNIEIDEVHLGKWKKEDWTYKPEKGDIKVGDWEEKDYDCFPIGRYIRQKAYVHTDEDYNIFQKYDKFGYYTTELKCAGLPDDAKKQLDYWTFQVGTTIEKKQHHIVPGGVCLKDTTYRIKET